jgi:hypothetical protein
MRSGACSSSGDGSGRRARWSRRLSRGSEAAAPDVGQRPVRWKRASYGAVHDLLTNPNVRLIDSWTPWLRAQQLISSSGSLAHIDP